MAASASTASSFTSSLGHARSYTYAHTSPDGSFRTQSSSAVSAVTSNSSAPPPTPLRPLDLGPPGYQATITLFERTTNETTVYLGPWEIVNTEPRHIRWQCSYQGEVLEHFLPSNSPADIYPHTLHARHRPYGDPCDLELFLTFLEPHRIRYVTSDNVLVHDDHVHVRYEFTTTEGSHRFQGDLRARDLVDHLDFDVVWSDRDSRTDSFGSVRGIGAIQRMKLWRDRYSTYHSFTFYANRTDHRYREYSVHTFDAEIRNRDDSHRRLRLTVCSRRGSASDIGGSSSSHSALTGRRFSMSSLRPRPRLSGSSHHLRNSHVQAEHDASAGSPLSSPAGGIDIRYLGIQFSRDDDYYRFIEQWAISQSADAQFRGVPFPTDRFELPSPEIPPRDRLELAGPMSFISLPIAEELQEAGEDGEEARS